MCTLRPARLPPPAAPLAAVLLAACSSGGRPERVFVSQSATGTVAVVDAASGELEARIEVGMLPHAMLVSPDGARLWVAVTGSQAVAEIDTDTGRLLRTLLTAPVPERRDDGSFIQGHLDRDAFSHTTCHDCHRTGGVEPRYAGDRPVGLALSADGARLFVSHIRGGRLTELDLATGAIARTAQLPPSGAASQAAALARLGDELWVALRPPQPTTEPGALRRLDAATWEVRGEVATGGDPVNLLALPGRGTVLVSNFETDTVSEHGASGARAVHVASPGPLGLVDLGAGRALAVGYYSNAVVFLDLAAGTSEPLPLRHGTVPYANPTHGALSSDGTGVWLVSSGTDGHLLRLDLATRRITKDVPIDGLSFGVAVAPAAP